MPSLFTGLSILFYSLFIIFYDLTLRAIVSLLTSFFISLLIGPWIISLFYKLKIGQVVRYDGPKSHIIKSGTPTMGGIIIITSSTISVLMWSYTYNYYIWCVLFVFFSYALLGFMDDNLKIVYNNANGLTVSNKYLFQSIIALLVSLIIFYICKDTTAGTIIFVPFFNNFIKCIFLYFLISYLAIVSTSNAINITDGLDGLAIILIIGVAAYFAFIAFATGNMHLSEYLGIPYIHLSGELVVVCTAIVGSCLGFLWFNTYPAQVFMGDIGSLGLGGALGTIAVLLRQEFMLIIIGGIFFIETLSVIMQILSFKLRGKRILRMAPIHHHYELKGYPEPRIIVRFWIISIILVIIGLLILKI